jgi:hypothetical protein
MRINAGVEIWCRGPGIVKHMSGTRWLNDREVRWHCVRSAPGTRRQGVWVSWFSLKTKVNGFFQFCLKIDGYDSCGLTSKPLTWVSQFGPQTSNCGLVIWPTKSPQRFFSWGLKTKWVMVYRLHHKINGRMKTTWDTRWDLVAYLAWKRVRLGFFSLASRLVEARCGWCT